MVLDSGFSEGLEPKPSSPKTQIPRMKVQDSGSSDRIRPPAGIGFGVPDDYPGVPKP